MWYVQKRVSTNRITGRTGMAFPCDLVDIARFRIICTTTDSRAWQTFSGVSQQADLHKPFDACARCRRSFHNTSKSEPLLDQQVGGDDFCCWHNFARCWWAAWAVLPFLRFECTRLKKRIKEKVIWLGSTTYKISSLKFMYCQGPTEDERSKILVLTTYFVL